MKFFRKIWEMIQEEIERREALKRKLPENKPSIIFLFMIGCFFYVFFLFYLMTYDWYDTWELFDGRSTEIMQLHFNEMYNESLKDLKKLIKDQYVGLLKDIKGYINF